MTLVGHGCGRDVCHCDEDKAPTEPDIVATRLRMKVSCLEREVEVLKGSLDVLLDYILDEKLPEERPDDGRVNLACLWVHGIRKLLDSGCLGCKLDETLGKK